ncbi:MAG: glucose 1-dehydrogenase [Xanthobacteraceae bacterium]|jgi:NAD(P)-dependent dehydrogenase (short-subunit alcohol dehydrogenase family)
MSYAMTLTGRTALVTGASGGLGRYFATVLARAGATVAVTARRPDQLQHVRDEIRGTGGDAVAVAMDVTDSSSVASAVAQVTAQLGALDILVNNAGITVTKSFLDVEEADWDRVVDTNLNGVFLVAQAAARVMKEQGGGGAIVNIASILGLRVAGQVAAYAAAKAGVVHLTKVMALELARYRIRVNALCPGYIETDLNREFFASDIGRALINRIPQRRLGRQEELEGPLLLMCSDAGSYMTGAVLAVDGGHLVSGL